MTKILLVDDAPDHTHALLHTVLKQQPPLTIVLPIERDDTMINNKRVLGILPSVGALLAPSYVLPISVRARKRIKRDKKKRVRKLAKYHRALNRHQRKSR